MKKRNLFKPVSDTLFKLSFIPCLALALSLGVCRTAHAEGSKGGGGGEVIAADFVRYAQFAIQVIKLDDWEKLFTQEEALKIEAALSSVQVYAHDPVCGADPNSGAVTCAREDAYYNAEKSEIWVNQQTWPKHECLRKMSLVLHEYGRVAGLENASYAFSSKVFVSTVFKNKCAQIASDEWSGSH